MKSSTAPPNASAQPMVDDFSVALSAGRVIGSQSASGQLRQGVDVEKTISIDNGALRFAPMVTPGWGRAGIAYGPYTRKAGLALSVFVLNGHNASEGNSIEETLKGRFLRWLRGSEAKSIKGALNRLLRWALSLHHRHRLRLFYRWVRNRKGRFSAEHLQEHLQENLAVGWFSETCPTNLNAGNAIVVRSAESENGMLCVKSDGRTLPAFKGLQNLQTYYIVVLRVEGAAYYAAALQGAGLSAYPYMRLLGIDTAHCEKQVFAGVHQNALGQVGFRVDSRVYGLHIENISSLSAWYGTAHMADRLIGHEGLNHTRAEAGGAWQVIAGDFKRTEGGLVGTQSDNIALIEMSEPAGAVHLIVKVACVSPECAVLWRTQDEHNTWALWFYENSCWLKRCDNGKWSDIAQDQHGLKPGVNTVQILDGGDRFSTYLNGALLFETWFVDPQLKCEQTMGLVVKREAEIAQGSLSFQKLEAHPRNIPVPAGLQLGEPWQRKGSQVVLQDSFAGQADVDLAGHCNDIGGQPWRKEMGKGRVLVSREAARVEASIVRPNPGRLAYTVAWAYPDFADLSVNILPPGDARGQGEKGRGGVVFWQDADHFVIINHWLDDTFKGSALSAFFQIDGFEEIYDAVWTNLGDRITWGKQHQLRVAFDGLNFMAYVNGEPVLYRSLRDVYPKLAPLRINRVGIVANWEWGDDTGTAFSQFVGKV